MKAGYLAVLAAASLATATPHNHNHNLKHQHLHKRHHAHNVERDAQAGIAEAATVWVCQLGDRQLTEEECQQGIANGTLVSPDGPLTQPSPVAPPPPPSSTSKPPPPPATSSADDSQPTGGIVKAASAPSSGGSGFIGGSGGTGVDSSFPDGELDCSDFPDQFGALNIPYLGLGGWTGVQCPGDSGAGGFNNIITALKGEKCTEGCYCSYACPAGYQKVQWPLLQGLTGQSVGGLQCKNGKLHRTNDDYQTLCDTGNQQVKVSVVNKLSSNAAVCRTDYPGTESETVPLNTQPGSTSPLTCPDAAKYYKWQGGQTSAQYYVNNQGVDVQDACSWNSAGSNKGNWAPVNLGVGYSNGAAWLAILANKPTNPNAKLDFTITLQGDNMSGKCQYKNGQYCSGDNYSNCNSDGCTVSVSSGTAQYVFS